MDDLRLALMCGTDIPIPECQLIVHQPTIEEISIIGEKNFFTGVQCLTISKTMVIEDKSLLENINNFYIFMTIIQDKDSKDKKEAVNRILQILFPDYQILFTPRTLVFKRDEETFNIDEDNFDYFQNTLKEIFCVKDSPMDKTSFNPANKKAKEIADKIMRGREIVAAQKGDDNNSIFSQYLSVLCVGIHIPIDKMIKLTMFQLYDLIQRYSMKVSWDIDIKARLAGSTSDEHPDNWMKNIH